MSEPLEKPGDVGSPDDAETEELVAYLDGELDAAASAAMATKISLDPKLRAKADSLKRAWDVLDILPKPRPSVNFASKTLSMVAPSPVTSASTIALKSAMATNVILPAKPGHHSGVWFLVISFFIVVIGFVIGFLGRGVLKPKSDENARDAEMINELSLLRNVRYFRNIDDMAYLRKLDSVDLFAEDD